MENINDVYEKMYLSYKEPPKHCERVFFHYTSPTGILGIFNTNNPKLYFSQYDSLNDLNERKDILHTLHKYCDIKVTEGKMESAFSDKIKEIKYDDLFLITETVEDSITLPSGETIDKINQISNKECYVYICSFSEKADSLPMWRMYAKSEHYEGYNIGFDRILYTSDSDYLKGYSLELKNVIYSEEEKFNLLDKLILPACEVYSKATQKEKNNFLSIIRNFIFKYQFIFKNPAFEYENEVRAILKIPKSKTGPIDNISERKFRTTSGVVIPYVEVEFPAYVIEEIHMAPSLHSEVAKSNLESFLSSKGYADINVIPSDIPVRNF